MPTLERFLHIALISVVFGAAAVNRAVAREPVTQPAPSQQPFPHAPSWIADQTLYEVNLRQFSAEGDVLSFSRQLPRLKDLGVGTLWFMPINPIGVAGHSGKLGSPYAVSDYTKFNPEFGTLEQFKATVDQAHRMGMFVIIDWVASHTSLDHPWVSQHPDWYKHDDKGQLVHPMPTWVDVAALNYDQAGLRTEMISAMTYWVSEVGVDGFRCDSAEFVPLDFWCQARNALRSIKPVFMLAEGNKPDLMDYAFDAAYAWYLPPNMEGIANGTKTVADLTNFFKAEAHILPGDGFRLNYTSNHDKNAWEGTTKELLNDSVDAFTILTFTVPGMPLIYNGQEAGVERRLNLFDRDPIAWRDAPAAGLYRTLAQLKRGNRALWDGIESAPLQFLTKDNHPSVLTYQREAHGDRVVVMLNLSNKPEQVPVPDCIADLRAVLGDKTSPDQSQLDLQPWAYRVWSSTH